MLDIHVELCYLSIIKKTFCGLQSVCVCFFIFWIFLSLLVIFDQRLEEDKEYGKCACVIFRVHIKSKLETPIYIGHLAHHTNHCVINLPILTFFLFTLLLITLSCPCKDYSTLKFLTYEAWVLWKRQCKAPKSNLYSSLIRKSVRKFEKPSFGDIFGFLLSQVLAKYYLIVILVSLFYSRR